MNSPYAAPNVSSAKSLTTVVYALQALYFLSGITMLVGVAINYWKKEEMRGTWLESHFRWQMDTFRGYVLLMAGFIMGMMLLLAGDSIIRPVGSMSRLVWMAIMLAIHGWYAYRIVKGWSRLNRNEPVS